MFRDKAENASRKLNKVMTASKDGHLIDSVLPDFKEIEHAYLSSMVQFTAIQ